MKTIALILFTAATMATAGLSSDEPCCVIEECPIECCEEKKACEPTCCIADASAAKECEQTSTETVAMTQGSACKKQFD